MRERVLANSGHLIDRLAALPGVEVVTSSRPERRLGIVALRLRPDDPDRLRTIYRALMEAGVLCALRSRLLRFAPHFYTPTEQLDAVIGRVAALLRS